LSDGGAENRYSKGWFRMIWVGITTLWNPDR